MKAESLPSKEVEKELYATMVGINVKLMLFANSLVIGLVVLKLIIPDLVQVSILIKRKKHIV